MWKIFFFSRTKLFVETWVRFLPTMHRTCSHLAVAIGRFVQTADFFTSFYFHHNRRLFMLRASDSNEKRDLNCFSSLLAGFVGNHHRRQNWNPETTEEVGWENIYIYMGRGRKRSLEGARVETNRNGRGYFYWPLIGTWSAMQTGFFVQVGLFTRAVCLSLSFAVFNTWINI